MVADVFIYMQILHINCIDSTNETLAANFYFRATWLQRQPDNNSNWKNEMKTFGRDGNANFPEGITNPQISFDNATEIVQLQDQSLQVSNHFRVSKDNGENGDNGDNGDNEDNGDNRIVVEWKARGSGTFIQSLSLQNYPFDIQHLKIHIASLSPQIRLRDDCYDKVKSTMRKDYFVDTGFVPIEIDGDEGKEKIKPIKGHEEDSSPGVTSVRGSFLISEEEEFVINRFNPQDIPFHRISYIVPVRRISRHAIEHLFTPVFLITFATFAAYAVPPEDVKGRLGISVTLALVITAYKYLAATSHLPILKERTICDDYILVAFIIVFAVIFQNYLAGHFACRGFCDDDREPEDVAELFDTISSWILFGLWVLWNIVTLVRVLWNKYEDEKKFLDTFKVKYTNFGAEDSAPITSPDVPFHNPNTA